MNKLGTFLKRKNIEFSVQRYFINAMGSMALGLFASLIVGLILDVSGEKLGISLLREFGAAAKSMAGPAIGVGVAFGLGAPPLTLFASTVTGSVGYAAGGPAGAFVAALFGAEFGKAVSRETKIEIIINPAVTIAAGFLAGTLVGPGISRLMEGLGRFIMWATELRPVPMGILVATTVGLALTAPISSAALAIMMKLGGIAAGAATAGCAAQMVGFAVASYRENGPGGLFAQGLGTSMLQIPNIVKNPWILVPPTVAGMITGPLATAVFKMENVPVGAGMGTSGLVGQFGTISAMGSGADVLAKIALLHFLLPAAIALAVSEFLRKRGKIKPGDYKLDI